MAEQTKLDPLVGSNRSSVSGTEIRGGKLYEDYLDTLNTPVNTYAAYNKMRRQDYQVKRMINAMLSPLKGGNYRFTPKDDSEEQVKQAYFKNNFYKQWPDRKWQEILNEVLTFPVFGFSIFEPYGKVVNDTKLGKIVTLANMGMLKQSTIYEWDIQKGKVKRVKQNVFSNSKYTNKWINYHYEDL